MTDNPLAPLAAAPPPRVLLEVTPAEDAELPHVAGLLAGAA
ncbi:MAG: hypothetical protein QOJ78_2496, partial [Pseudonocardiales bacterium]|nr:hypothetical protein [Pseudonocardiales bacterium]